MPKITYNGYEFPNVYGVYNFIKTSTNLSISFRFVILKNSSEAVIAEESEMLPLLKVVKAKTTIVFNESTEFDLAHATNGFNARCTVEKITSSYSAETSRAFSCLIEMELPYTQDAGRIKASWSIEYNTAHKATVMFNVLYSASEQKSSYDIANTDSQMWTAYILKTFFPGTVFETIEQSYSNDQNLKRTTYSGVFREVFYEYGDKAIDNIFNNVRVTYTIETDNKIATMLTSSTESMKKITLYANITATILEAAEQCVRDFYEAYITKLLVDAEDLLKLEYITDVGATIIETLHLSFDPTNGHFYASIKITILSKSKTYISIHEQIKTTWSKGTVLDKLFDGQDYTYHISYRGATGTLTRVVTAAMEESKQAPLPEMNIKFGLKDNQEWFHVDSTQDQWKEYVGQDKLPIVFMQKTEYYILIDVDKSKSTIIERI